MQILANKLYHVHPTDRYLFQMEFTRVSKSIQCKCSLHSGLLTKQAPHTDTKRWHKQGDCQARAPSSHISEEGFGAILLFESGSIPFNFALQCATKRTCFAWYTLFGGLVCCCGSWIGSPAPAQALAAIRFASWHVIMQFAIACIKALNGISLSRPELA